MKRCYCGRCELSTEDADLVVNGRPLCDPDCIFRARRERIHGLQDASLRMVWKLDGDGILRQRPQPVLGGL